MKVVNIKKLKKISEGVDCAVYKKGNKVFKAYQNHRLRVFGPGTKQAVMKIHTISIKAANEGLAPKVFSPVIKWQNCRKRGWGFWTEYAKRRNAAMLCDMFQSSLQKELKNVVGKKSEDFYDRNVGVIDDMLVFIDFGEFGW